MNILNNGRFGLGAGAASQVKRMMALVAQHAVERIAFKQPLSSFDMIKEKFANMAIDSYAVESMAYMTTAMIDRGNHPYH
jgi:acyl-CoA dehydrogenase family member 9